MKNSIRKKWIAALRSGKYKQGRGCLKNSNEEYCCLGVLCDVIDPTGWIERKIQYNNNAPYIYISYRYDDQNESNNSVTTTFLPIPYRESVGLTWQQELELFKLNDEKNLSFDQIADHLEGKSWNPNLVSFSSIIGRVKHIFTHILKK